MLYERHPFRHSIQCLEGLDRKVKDVGRCGIKDLQSNSTNYQGNIIEFNFSSGKRIVNSSFLQESAIAGHFKSLGSRGQHGRWNISTYLKNPEEHGNDLSKHIEADITHDWDREVKQEAENIRIKDENNK